MPARQPGRSSTTSSFTSIAPATDQSLRPRRNRLHTRRLGAGRHAGDVRAGTARLIPKGSKLLFEVHYTPNGTEQTDRSSVGVIFAKKPPEHRAETNILANMLVKIPPGKANVKGEITYTFPDDALVLSFMPHMHLRGTSTKYVAIYPDGKTETLALGARLRLRLAERLSLRGTAQGSQGDEAGLDRGAGTTRPTTRATPIHPRKSAGACRPGTKCRTAGWIWSG